ncbi:MAG: pyridine nucleotide-disulfide oxidoreductase, partial [Desulfuromonas sp.]
GVFPLIAKRLLTVLKLRKVYAGHRKPRHFDYNLLVVGAGSAGLVSAYIAAAVKAKVALVEKHKMGGDCLNTGCVPSKALLRSAKMISYASRSQEFGLHGVDVQFDFAEVMERVQRVVSTVEPHDSIERYKGLGVDVLTGTARVTGPWTVEVDGNELSARNIIIATGASPYVPPIKGIEQIDYLTSDNLWALRELPQKLIVLGGGPIGCEMTQAFARLGSRVVQIEMGDRIVPREDPEVSDYLVETFEREGIRVLTGHLAREVRLESGRQWLVCEHLGRQVKIEFDRLLVAVGRKANTEGFGLEELGVQIDSRGTVAVDALLRTNFPNIYCAGDVVGPYQFTHTAAHQAWYATVNALFGQFKTFKVDYRVIPWCTFTDAEIARVGLNESEALAQGIPFEETRFGIDDLDRAIADGEAQGWIKVLTRPGSDKILGVTIVGHHAGDLLAEYVLAMKYNLGLNKILGTIHTYPTLAESNKMVAGEWKKAHAPQKLLEWVSAYHRWRRG